MANYKQDKGRILSQEEMESIEITPVEQINHKCWITGTYYWGEKHD